MHGHACFKGLEVHKDIPAAMKTSPSAKSADAERIAHMAYRFSAWHGCSAGRRVERRMEDDKCRDTGKLSMSRVV